MKTSYVVIIIGVMILFVIIGIFLVFNPQFSPITEGFRGNRYVPPPPAKDFTLVNQDGMPVTLSDYSGNKIIVISFIYTHCPDICPLITSGFSGLENLLEKDGLENNVMLFLVSLDILYSLTLYASDKKLVLLYRNSTTFLEKVFSKDIEAAYLSEDSQKVLVKFDNELLIMFNDGTLISRFTYSNDIESVATSHLINRVVYNVGDTVYYIKIRFENGSYTYKTIWTREFNAEIKYIGMSGDGGKVWVVLGNDTVIALNNKSDVLYTWNLENISVSATIKIASGGIGAYELNGEIYIAHLSSEGLNVEKVSNGKLLAISNNGMFIAYESERGLRILDLVGNKTFSFNNIKDVYSAGFSSDGAYLVVSSGSATYLINTYHGEILWSLPDLKKAVSVETSMDRDSMDRLRRWRELFGLKYTNVLTGNYSYRKIILSSYGIYASNVEVDDPNLAYIVAHTGIVYVISKDFKIHLFYLGAPPQWNPEDIYSDIKILLSRN